MKPFTSLTISEKTLSFDINASHSSYWSCSNLFLEEIYDLIHRAGEQLKLQEVHFEKLLECMDKSVSPGYLFDCLDFLLKYYPQVPSVKTEAFKYMPHKDFKLMTRALAYLGTEGWKIIDNMMMDIKNFVTLDREIQANLLYHFIRSHKEEGTLQLKSLLVKNISATNVEVIKALQAYKGPERFIQIMDIVKADFSFRRPPEQEAFIQLLEVKGTAGDLEFLNKLLNLTWHRNVTIMNSIRKAIAHIRSRMGEVEDGWLSISGAEEMEGALTVSHDEGSLELSDESGPEPD